MPNSQQFSSANSVAPTCDEEKTYFALKSLARRKLLVALALHGPQTGYDLRHVGRATRGWGTYGAIVPLDESFLDSTVKNLKVMMDAGIVVQLPNPKDGRRPLYALAPGLKVTVDGEFALVDFGFIVTRLTAEGI